MDQQKENEVIGCSDKDPVRFVWAPHYCGVWFVCSFLCLGDIGICYFKKSARGGCSTNDPASLVLGPGAQDMQLDCTSTRTSTGTSTSTSTST